MDTAQQEESAATDIAEFSRTEAALVELEARWKTVPDFTQKDGYETGRKGIRELVSLRTSLDAKRKQLNQSDHDRINYRNTEAKRITGQLVALEAPLKDAKQAVDRAEEERKQAAREAEERRVAETKAKIENMGNLINMLSPAAPADQIERRLVSIRSFVVNEAEYGEFTREAQAEQVRVIGVLRSAHKERTEYEAGQDELKQQREEQEKVAAAQAEQQKKLDDERKAIEAERAEASKVMQEAQEKAEAEKRRVETARLDEIKRQREEKEAAERAEAERIEREKRQAAEAERIEAMKPDKVKLRNLAKRIDSIKLPELTTPEGSAILNAAVAGLEGISAKINAATG